MRKRLALLGLVLSMLAAAAAAQGSSPPTTFTHDPNGNLTSKIENGVVWTYIYDSRNLLREVQRDGVILETYQSFLFTGHELDEATGLYYAKGRYLDPELGRFLTEDRASGKALEPLSLHKYLYARSNPARFIDPDGREAIEVTASGQARALNGRELYRILVHQEGLSPQDASRIVILSELGADLGADRTAAMAPFIVGAGELTGILPAERALANPYVQGSLQIVGGTAEVGLGLAAAGTGAGAVVSPVLAAHGGDTIGTGIRTLMTGEAQETLTHRGLRAGAGELGAHPSTAAFAADLGEVGLVGLAGTGAATAIPSSPPTHFGDLPTPQPSAPQAMVVTESSNGGVDLVPAQSAAGNPQSSAAAGRPTWQESEAYFAQQLEGFGFREQVSYVRGQEVRRGLRGSVRPDEASQLMQLSVDVKNYNLTTDAGRSALVQDVLHQVNSRVANLPSHMMQGLILDVRGQTVDAKLLQDLVTRISTRTNGVIAPENIHVEH